MKKKNTKFENNEIEHIGEYTAVKIFFPEFFSKNIPFKEESREIRTDYMYFTRKDYGISVGLNPAFRIPRELSLNVEIQSKIIRPTIDLVVSELSEIEDLFPILRELSRKGFTDNTFMYTRTNCPEVIMSINKKFEEYTFKVHDREVLNFYSNSRYKTVFQKTLFFKNISKSILKEKFYDIHEKSQYIIDNMPKDPSKLDRTHSNLAVVGKNLRIATQRAIDIYNLNHHYKKYIELKEIFQ